MNYWKTKQQQILATKNNIVDDFNFNIQKKILGDEIQIHRHNGKRWKKCHLSYRISKLCGSITMSSTENLIILFKNLNLPKLCKETKMIVKQLSSNIIKAKLITGKNKRFIPRIRLMSTKLLFQLKKLHFPTKLAYSSIVNKVEEQSLEYCVINLRLVLFSWWTYVALQ